MAKDAPLGVLGPYTLLEQIAVGGMAEIYLAKTSGLAGFEKYLCLKVIHPNFADDEQFIEMLIDEAKIAVGLNHANIAQIFDLGRDGKTYFIAMEYIDGADLFKVMRQLSEIDYDVPIDVAAYIAHEICTGLDYAHRKRDRNGQHLGIIHRDISPQNILISGSGEIKIVDFGIAKAQSRTRRTQAGIIKGKYFYMSPEQAWGDTVDQRSDIFSAGIILYEVLTGQMLYLEDDMNLLLNRVRKAEIPPPSTRRAGIPRALEAIVMKALSKQVTTRYQTAHEFQQALSSFLFSSSPEFTPSRLAQLLEVAFGPATRAPAPAPRAAAPGSFRGVDERRLMSRVDFMPRTEHSVLIQLPNAPRGDTLGTPHDTQEEQTLLTAIPGADAQTITDGRAVPAALGLDDPRWYEQDGVPTQISRSPVLPSLGAGLGEMARRHREQSRAQPPAKEIILPTGKLGRLTGNVATDRSMLPPQSGLTPTPLVEFTGTRNAPDALRVHGGKQPRLVPLQAPAPAAAGRGAKGELPPPLPKPPPIPPDAGRAKKPTNPFATLSDGDALVSSLPAPPSLVVGARPRPKTTRNVPVVAPQGAPPAASAWPGPTPGDATTPDKPLTLAASALQPQLGAGWAPAAPPPVSAYGSPPESSVPPATSTWGAFTPTSPFANTTPPDPLEARRRRLIIGAILGGAGLALVIAVVLIVTLTVSRKQGALEIISVPEGGAVTFDGQPIAKPTPVVIPVAVFAKSHRVQVSLANYVPWTRTVEMSENEPSMRVLAVLTPIYGRLELTSDPPGADIFINRRRSGTTPQIIENLLPKGSVRIELRHRGYKPATRVLPWEGRSYLSAHIIMTPSAR